VPIDPNQLPQDADTLRKIVLDLVAQLDRAFAEQHKYEELLRELIEAQRTRKSSDREEHGEREFTGASDRGEVGRSSATTSAGKDVRTAWRADLAQNDGRLDGAMRGAARSVVRSGEEGSILFQVHRHRRYQRESTGSQASVREDRTDMAVPWRLSSSRDRVRLYTGINAITKLRFGIFRQGNSEWPKMAVNGSVLKSESSNTSGTKCFIMRDL
jgi:hypothetical protein